MADTTTVKVQRTTRDLLLQLGASRRQSAAQEIRNDRTRSPRSGRSRRTGPLCMRGEVFRLPARGRGHEQRGRRFAVVLQPDWLNLGTWIVAFTSSSARETTFRPSVVIAGQETLVMCAQLDTVDINRLHEPVGFLSVGEMQRIDEALALVLDL